MKVALCSMLSKQESYSDHVTNTTAEIPKLSIFTSNLDKTKLCLNLILTNYKKCTRYLRNFTVQSITLGLGDVYFIFDI